MKHQGWKIQKIQNRYVSWFLVIGCSLELGCWNLDFAAGLRVGNAYRGLSRACRIGFG